MHGWLRIVGFVVAAVVMAGCAPAITVENKTSQTVRAVVTQGAGSPYGYTAFPTVISPRPGQSASVPAIELGRYSVAVAYDADWVAYAKEKRDELQARLGDPAKLSGRQLQEFIKSMNGIAEQLDLSIPSRCSGTLGNWEDDVLVEVRPTAGGTLAPTCGTTRAKR